MVEVNIKLIISLIIITFIILSYLCNWGIREFYKGKTDSDVGLSIFLAIVQLILIIGTIDILNSILN